MRSTGFPRTPTAGCSTTFCAGSGASTAPSSRIGRWQNTGERAGDEVVQLYIRDEVSLATRPGKELKGFRRIRLAAGERRPVTFEVGPEPLSYHGPDLKRVVEPGRFSFMVVGNSAEAKSIRLEVVVP